MDINNYIDQFNLYFFPPFIMTTASMSLAINLIHAMEGSGLIYIAAFGWSYFISFIIFITILNRPR